MQKNKNSHKNRHAFQQLDTIMVSFNRAIFAKYRNDRECSYLIFSKFNSLIFGRNFRSMKLRGRWQARGYLGKLRLGNMMESSNWLRGMETGR